MDSTFEYKNFIVKVSFDEKISIHITNILSFDSYEGTFKNSSDVTTFSGMSLKNIHSMLILFLKANKKFEGGFIEGENKVIIYIDYKQEMVDDLLDVNLSFSLDKNLNEDKKVKKLEYHILKMEEKYDKEITDLKNFYDEKIKEYFDKTEGNKICLTLPIFPPQGNAQILDVSIITNEWEKQLTDGLRTLRLHKFSNLWIDHLCISQLNIRGKGLISLEGFKHHNIRHLEFYNFEINSSVIRDAKNISRSIEKIIFNNCVLKEEEVENKITNERMGCVETTCKNFQMIFKGCKGLSGVVKKLNTLSINAIDEE